MATSLLQSFRDLNRSLLGIPEEAEADSPPSFEPNTEAVNGSSHLHVRESIDPSAVMSRLISLGIPKENIILDDNGYIHLPITSTMETPPSLPQGYGYKGGAARWLLAESMGLRPHIPPRDLDVIRLEDNPEKIYEDHRVAMTFMERDYRYGDGIDICTDAEKYFTERDITINQVYTAFDEVVATPACIADTLDRVICLTDFEHARYGGPGYKMVAKLLRFQAQFELESGKPWTLHEEQLFIRELEFYRGTADIFSQQTAGNLPAKTTPFYIAIQLDRALQIGEPYAMAFIGKLVAFGHLPREMETPGEVWEYLKPNLPIDLTLEHIDKHLSRRDQEERRSAHLEDIQDRLERGKVGRIR